MRSNHIIRQIMRPIWLLALLVFSLVGASATLAQVGTPIPDNAPLSDQKPGSVLLFNYFRSSATGSPATNDTLLSLTNTHPSSMVRVVLYFITASNSAPTYVCIAPNQSISFQLSHVFPGEIGAMMAVAVDQHGYPLKFNYLRGSATLKFPAGYTGSYNAIAISKLTNTNPPSTVEEPNVTAMNFDGVSYNQLPAVLALDHVPSVADGNETIFVLNQWSGNLGKNFQSNNHGTYGAPPNAVGTMKSDVYRPTGQAALWNLTGTGWQFVKRISATSPEVPGGMESWIPSNSSGWMRFAPSGALNGRAFTGLVMYYRANASTTTGAFVGIRNLPHFTLTTSTISIPRLIPTC